LGVVFLAWGWKSIARQSAKTKREIILSVALIVVALVSLVWRQDVKNEREACERTRLKESELLSAGKLYTNPEGARIYWEDRYNDWVTTSTAQQRRECNNK
jgi:hypothetical protein